MTTSGVAVFDLDFTEAIEEAFERAGIESRSGYDMKTSRRSINLLFADWANRGVNLWTVEERSVPLVAGIQAYTLEADIVDLIEYMLQVPDAYSSSVNGPTRYNLTRASVSTFASHTNPRLEGRPTQIYINRLTNGPVVHLWPTPQIEGYTLVYWVLRRIQDAGAYTNTGDFPFRFLPPFISGLAYMIAVKKRQDDPMLIQRLKMDYAEDWQRAADEDREKATLRQVPAAYSYRVGRLG